MFEDRDLDYYLDAAARQICKVYNLSRCSDRELAKRIGVGSSTLNNWRTKRSLPEDAVMAAIAERGGQDVEIALLHLSAWRAAEPARSAYLNIARRLGRAAASFFLAGTLAATALALGAPRPASATTATAGTERAQVRIEAGAVYIMENRRRRRTIKETAAALGQVLREACTGCRPGMRRFCGRIAGRIKRFAGAVNPHFMPAVRAIPLRLGIE